MKNFMALFLSITLGTLLPLLLLHGNSPGNSATQTRNKNLQGQTGTLERLIVESGSVTMEVDLDRLGGRAQSSGELEETSSRIFSELRFVVAENSLFSLLVFNDLLRAPSRVRWCWYCRALPHARASRLPWARPLTN